MMERNQQEASLCMSETAPPSEQHLVTVTSNAGSTTCASTCSDRLLSADPAEAGILLQGV